MLEIVNVVAAGKLGSEIDVLAVAEDVDAASVKLSKESYSHQVVYLRQENGGPMATLFRSGSYHITGADSTEQVEEMKDWMVVALEDLGIKVMATFAVKNVVLTGDLGHGVDLNKLVIALGLEKTEYEPEQFPGVIYRPQGVDCVFLIFASGKVVITGSPNVETATTSFEELTEKLALLNSL